MDGDVLLIGFGEVGRALAAGWREAELPTSLSTYDIKLDDPDQRPALAEAARSLNVGIVPHELSSFVQARHIISAVTADQALVAASRAASLLSQGAVFWDLNSVAPATKCAAAEKIQSVGGKYLDVGVLAPIHPKRHKTPIAIAGNIDGNIVTAIDNFEFEAEILSDVIGEAAALKLLRSIVIKGLEGVLVECHLACKATGQGDKVLASLALSFPGINWPDRMAYVLERVEIHGARRAAEMAETAKFLHLLGVQPVMTKAAGSRLAQGIISERGRSEVV